MLITPLSPSLSKPNQATAAANPGPGGSRDEIEDDDGCRNLWTRTATAMAINGQKP
jgi:hypothetical protein